MVIIEILAISKYFSDGSVTLIQGHAFKNKPVIKVSRILQPGIIVNAF